MLNRAQTKQIYEFPAVEYIPLYPQSLHRQSAPPSAVPGQPAIRPCQNASAWQETCRQYGVPADAVPYIAFPQEIGLLLAEWKASECRYRDRRVTVVGEPDPGMVQLLKLPTRLFYQRSLEFLLFSPAGAKIARARIEI